ncbi:MAG TPA: hypothetical protein P5186_13880 [Candidatus Paceibacterota bacterium]|nr:hypothetical protein [Verrucomicrobiota bacterium]HRY49133.1 hypothetical protein [Candidatus Paceibacterota bacterium]HRZ99839.1 hypothetical protein [Candidatus Paceibacterota bacterium]
MSQMFHGRRVLTLMIALTLFVAGRSASQGGLMNGSFETGDLTGWTDVGGHASVVACYVGPWDTIWNPVDGQYFAVVPKGEILHQDVTLLPGDQIGGSAGAYGENFLEWFFGLDTLHRAEVNILDNLGSVVATPLLLDNHAQDQEVISWQAWSWTASAGGTYTVEFKAESTEFDQIGFFDANWSTQGVPESMATLILGPVIVGLFGIRRFLRS